jgi:long-chain acyl-CoA synthetase
MAASSNEGGMRGESAHAGHASDLREVSNPAELPEGTLAGLFLNAVDTYDKRSAQLVRGADGWQSISHRELLGDVVTTVGALDALGVRRGDRVALLSENRPEWALVDYAVICAGALTVPLYPTLPANQVAFIVRHAGARVIFVSTAEQAAKIEQVRSELPDLEHVHVFDGAAAGGGAFRDLLESARGRVTEQDVRARAAEVRPEDTATIIYTSGTTGEPKGVMLTHRNLYTNTQAVSRLVTYGPGDTALSFLPLSHVLQRMVDYMMFGAGVTLAYVESIDDVARALVEVKPTIAVAVPRVYEKLYAKILAAEGLKRRLVLWARQVALDWSAAVLEGAPMTTGLKVQHAIADRLVFSKLRAKLGGELRFFVSGGAPLSPQIARFFFGAGVTILEGYGLTETSPVTNVNTPEHFRIGTVGKAVPGTEIRIADDGEILIRGPQVMKGYYANDKATAEVLRDDGWFSTGDIGSIDADGFLRITDRKKEILVTAGGKNVAPQPIENAAKTSRYVAEAVMIGDRRPFPILLVVPNFDSLGHWASGEGITAAGPEALVANERARSMVEQDIAERLAGFARYEMPKKVVLLEREFSLEKGEITPTLKVKRRVIEQHFRDRIDPIYADGEPDFG